MPKNLKNKQGGGLIKGKSHEEGGEIIEVEGKEIVVNNSGDGDGCICLLENRRKNTVIREGYGPGYG